jgi:predicted RNase H-like nuclease (RuvC/YqgF family)
MSTYDQYIKKVKNEEIVSYQETKKHLDNLVELGLIDIYDEGKIAEYIKKYLPPFALATTLLLPNQKNLTAQEKMNYAPSGVENSINIKKDINNLEAEVSTLKRHSEEFKARSENFNNTIKEIQDGIKYLKKEDLIDESKAVYYTNIIDTLKKYIQDSAMANENFDMELKSIKKEK